MTEEVYTLRYTHEVFVDGELIKREDPIQYRYTSIRPLGYEELREMIDFVSNAIMERLGVNDD